MGLTDRRPVWVGSCGTKGDAVAERGRKEGEKERKVTKFIDIYVHIKQNSLSNNGINSLAWPCV